MKRVINNNILWSKIHYPKSNPCKVCDKLHVCTTHYTSSWRLFKITENYYYLCQLGNNVLFILEGHNTILSWCTGSRLRIVEYKVLCSAYWTLCLYFGIKVVSKAIMALWPHNWIELCPVCCWKDWPRANNLVKNGGNSDHQIKWYDQF